jgi:hypothetical protein
MAELLEGRPSSPRCIASSLAGHEAVEDGLFDAHLPATLRAVPGVYWTPLEVAQRAAQWLDAVHARSVVDIGSGAGKFCVAAELAGHCQFIGLEQREWLVEAARDLAATFAVEERVTFVTGALGRVTLPVPDAYYFYNPFEENLFEQIGALDRQVELSLDRYHADIAATQRLLERAPLGTFALTYNGLGGPMPRSYHRVRVDSALPSVLAMWQKRAFVRGRTPSLDDHPATGT